jgi:predicted ATP-grasp superfamily ATP-dependent carboligase
VQEHASRLRDGFLFPALDPGLVARVTDKAALAGAIAAPGLASPATALVRTREEAETFCAEAGMPVVVKAGAGPRAPGERSVVIVDRPDDLQAMLARRGALILQEHVAGSPRRVNWIFDGVFDAAGRCVFWGTARKVAQHPPYAGTATHAITERNEALATAVIDALERLGYVGPVDVDLRVDERDGRFLLLDLNPRIGATFRAFVSPGGLDVARCAYLTALGEDVPAVTIPDGRGWILESHLATCLLPYRRDGWLTVGGWLRSFAGVREGGLLARDDFRPAARAAGHVVRRVWARAFGARDEA